MNKYALFVFVAIFVNGLATPLRTYFEDYCWREYQGVIPADALPGGLDRNGELIYIGQALHDGKLIPGKIYPHEKKIFFEHGDREHSTSENIKILCSPHPERFEWIPTRHDQVVGLTTKLLIKGGYQKDFCTYIGRAFAAGETSVGKIICRETGQSECEGLYTVHNGKSTKHKNAFEILTYNP